MRTRLKIGENVLDLGRYIQVDGATSMSMGKSCSWILCDLFNHNHEFG
jgi:hypothetical protein